MTAQVFYFLPREQTAALDPPRTRNPDDRVTVCPVCRLHFDLDDVRQVFEHMHGRKPQIRLVE